MPDRPHRTGSGAGDVDRGQGGPTLRDLGEFTVIDRLVAGRPPLRGVSVGAGDDAAVVDAPDSRVVVSTDMLVADRHFRLDWSTPHDVGRRAIAQNAADIEAMGARVTAFVVAFGAPPDTPAAAVQELADGMWQEAGRADAGIVGGDLVSCPQWVISVTALGDLGGRTPVRRSGARPGAVVAVIGDLGCAAAGLALYRNGIDEFAPLRGRHRVPCPPYGQGRVAAEAGAQAMTDVSDGLMADLGHLAVASGVVVDLDRELPRADADAVSAAAARAGVDPWSLVLGGGEDHCLVACFPADIPPGWRPIGVVRTEVSGGGAAAVLLDGERWAGVPGWQSYT